MAQWYTVPQDIPVDGVDCWVRLNYWFGQPFVAQWSHVKDEWTDVLAGIVFPAWAISRWRYVNP